MLVNKNFCFTVVLLKNTLLSYCLVVLFTYPQKRGGVTLSSTNSPLTGNFVKALSYYIAVSGKTKKEIADAIGVPPTTFSSWSNGKHLPDMDKLQTLAKYLNVPISQFFNFTELDTPPDPLVAEMLDIYIQLPSEEKLIVKAVASKFLQLHGE